MTDYDYETVKAERDEQILRLERAGIDHDNGGVDMTTGQWDIFAYPKTKTGQLPTYATILNTVEEVDDIIAKHGRQLRLVKND